MPKASGLPQLLHRGCAASVAPCLRPCFPRRRTCPWLSPVNGGQLRRSDANGELSTVEVGFSPGFVDGEVPVAVAFILRPEERAGVGVHGLWQGWGRAEDMQDAGATGEAAPSPAPHQQTNAIYVEKKAGFSEARCKVAKTRRNFATATSFQIYCLPRKIRRLAMQACLMWLQAGGALNEGTCATADNKIRATLASIRQHWGPC